MSLAISIDHLSLMARILCSRLTRPSTVEIVIAYPECYDRLVPLDRYAARFVGGFKLTEDGEVCLLLIHRSKDECDVDHVFCWYLNHCHFEIQEAELNTLSHYVPNVSDPDSDIHKCVINVIVDGEPSQYLSTFLEVIDSTIGDEIVHDFSPRRLVETSCDLAIGILSTRVDRFCQGSPSKDAVDLFKATMNFHNIQLAFGNKHTELRNPSVVMIKTRGHIVGGFYLEEFHTFAYLVTHGCVFENKYHYEEVKAFVTSWYGAGSSLRHTVIRFYPNSLLRCDDSLVVEAWKLVISMRPFVPLVIQENELHLLNGDLHKIGFWPPDPSDPTIRPQFVAVANLPRTIGELDRAAFRHMQLDFGSQSYYPLRASPEGDTNAQIGRETDHLHDPTLLNELSASRKRVRDSMVPPVHKIGPYNDLTQDYLKILPSYLDGLRLMAEIFSRFAPTVMVHVPYGHDEVPESLFEGSHFVIYQFVTCDGSDCIVLSDMIAKRWIFLNPDNEAYKDKAYFDDIIRPYVSGLCPELAALPGEAILMTSISQTGYPRLHLLIGLYVVSRLFRYSRTLPKKLIYLDLDLRRYANNICTELQIVNAKKNIEDHLVDANGRLVAGAIQSLASPLVADNKVVPKDQCMFCKKRFKANLGRHMAAEHGGQASFASHSRLK